MTGCTFDGAWRSAAGQETIGPVLSILRYEDEDDALRIANSTVYGLAGAV